MRNKILSLTALFGFASIAIFGPAYAEDGAHVRYTCRENKLSYPEYQGNKVIVLQQVQSGLFLSPTKEFTAIRFRLDFYEGNLSQTTDEILEYIPINFTGESKYMRQFNKIVFRSDRNRLREGSDIVFVIPRDEMHRAYYRGESERYHFKCNEEFGIQR